METSRPIGLFDSGVGGTSIWTEVHKLLPYENTVYLADSKYAPYGNRPSEEIIELSLKNVRKLIEFGCKLIVVACNTATTNAIDILRKEFDIPLIGLEPAIKPAALHSVTKRIGVLATKGTLSSALFHRTSTNYANDVQIIEVVGEGLVPLIEAGELDSPEMMELLKKHTKPMIEANADYMVLGSTHFPYLIPSLQKIVPESMKIIDSGHAVARHTKKILEENNLLNEAKEKPSLRFFSNNDLSTLQKLLSNYSNIIEVNLLDF